MRRGHPEDPGDDIEFFLQEETDENIARGMTPQEARLAARRKFGNTLHVHEEVRWVWFPRWLDDFAQDLRYAWRSYRRAKLFTATLLLMLALGIGVNAAVFSLVNAMLLRPLPYPEANRLVAYSDDGKAARFKSGILVADLQAWRERSRTFELLAGYQYRDEVLSAGSDAVPVRAAAIAGDFWRILGVQPGVGRLFEEEAAPGSAVVSHRIFTQFFGGDPGIVGKPALLAGNPILITGVLPPAFRLLLPEGRVGLESREPDVFLPSGPLLRGDPRRVSVVGRLREGETAATALTEIRKLQSDLWEESKDRWFAGTGIMKLEDWRANLAGRATEALTVLQIAALLVLLIACANIAGLLMARGMTRQREVAIRISIGAGRGRLLRQYLCEGLFLTLCGGAGGVLLSRLLLGLMHRWGAQVLPRLAEAELDHRVMLFTMLLSLASTLLFCFWPATIPVATTSLTLRSHGASKNAGNRTLRAMLSGAELALAVVLAIGAGLMIRSFGAMYAAVPGFEPARVLVMQLSLSGAEYKERTRTAATIAEVEAALRSLPGVWRAGVAQRESYLLQSASSAVPNVVDRFDESLVTPEYFSAIGMRLVRGRWLEEHDAADASVINETMARRMFGTGDPVGRSIKHLGRAVRVVGVAADLKYARMDGEVTPEVFRGYAQNVGGRPSLVIAMLLEGDPKAVAAAARSRLSAIAPRQAIHGVQTLEARLSDSIAPRRLNLAVLLGFAAASMLMALIGIYGVVAYSVTQRTQEIGIRRALGASSSRIAGSVLASGLGPAVVGIVVGLLGAMAFTRWMTSLVYGVQPLDLVTFATVPLLLLAATVMACLVPALRAIRIEPLIALRFE